MLKCDRGEIFAIKLYKVPTQKENHRSSSDTNQYVMPRTNQQTFAVMALSVRGPRVWNSLPLDIRDSDNLCQFKKKLKIF